jgi:hypothetical protein
LWLGRPIGIKSSDIELSPLTDRFASLHKSQPAGNDKQLETQIYIALLELMEHVVVILKILDRKNSADDRASYFSVAALDKELNTWYKNLEPTLRWTRENINTAPSGFFLLQ